jgi:carbon monoxide dehydrogenase subunit G
LIEPPKRGTEGGSSQRTKGDITMIKIEHSTVINRPIEEVFAFLEDSNNDPKWQTGVLEVEKTSEGAVGVGTTFREIRKFLGRQFETIYEITEHEFNKKLSSKAASGPIPFMITTTFEAVETGTRVTVVGEAEPGGFFKLGESVISRSFEKSLEADFTSLKAIMEEGASGGT